MSIAGTAAVRRGRAPVPRLRRSSPDAPGLTRRRRGKGFAYRDERGEPVTESVVVQRIDSLAIPPAWVDVWICSHPNGHLQAVGTDAAGRRQYLYHPHWRDLRDAEKHRRTVQLGQALPRARKRVSGALRQHGLTRERVLAASFRLLDVASFRIGSESYAVDNGTYGLATLQRQHVKVQGNRVSFRYEAKGAIDRVQSFVDPAIARVVTELLERDDPDPDLLAWHDGSWHDVTSSDINTWVRDLTGGDFTAKDLRTWNATVLMAQLLAAGPRPTAASARARAITKAYRQVAEYLGNTPTVARVSYVDSRIVDLYRDGVTVPAAVLPKRQRDLPVHGRVERAVLRLLK